MKGIPMYLCIISALLLLGAGETASGQKATTGDISNPFAGTWVLNPDKSSNNIPLKSDIVKIKAENNGLKLTFDRVTTGGDIIHQEMSPKFDDKYYPIFGSSDIMTSLRRINTNSYELVKKRYSNENHNVMVISEDGMTSTSTVKGKDSQGQEYTLILVYDKQED